MTSSVSERSSIDQNISLKQNEHGALNGKAVNIENGNFGQKPLPIHRIEERNHIYKHLVEKNGPELGENESVITEDLEKVTRSSVSIPELILRAIALPLTSRILRPLLVSAIVSVVLFVLISNPFGLMTTISIILASFIVTIFVGALFDRGKHMQKIEFECSTFARLMKDLFKKKDYDPIFNHPTTRNKVFLGALPNQYGRFGFDMVKNGVRSVLSVNEKWERKPLGLSVPYQWDKIPSMKYAEITVKDHNLLSIEALDEASDWIEKRLQEGSVYIHCRAGKGRSAMAAAAHLIDRHAKSFEENGNISPTALVDRVADHILKRRPVSTIQHKKENKTKKGTTQFGLYHYAQHVRDIKPGQ